MSINREWSVAWIQSSLFEGIAGNPIIVLNLEILLHWIKVVELLKRYQEKHNSGKIHHRIKTMIKFKLIVKLALIVIF